MFPGRFKEDTEQLNNIEGLLKGRIKGKVFKHEIEPLTSFGENFGSEMLKVDIFIEEDGKQKVLHAVAKLIPPTEMQLEIFNTQLTFKNEIAFYAQVFPALQDIQREYGFLNIMDYFADYYGSRISLKENSDVVDTDAVILLENLKIEGYTNIDRQEGFDLETSKKILQVLANFQATAIGLKLKKPDVFSSEVKPFLSEHQPPKMEYTGINPMLRHIEPTLNENTNTAPLISKVNKCLGKKWIRKRREPWATIVHSDLWVNNIMLKLESHSIKLVDFQIADYGSPAIDLLFFLFSSVQTPVLRYHFDKLVLYYYNELIKNLVQFKVDIKNFSYESFQEEIKHEVGREINHVLFFLPNVIFGPKGMPKAPGKVREWNPNNEPNGSSYSSHSGPAISNGKPPQMPLHKLPMECKEKIWFIVETAVEKNWI